MGETLRRRDRGCDAVGQISKSYPLHNMRQLRSPRARRWQELAPTRTIGWTLLWPTSIIALGRPIIQ